MDSQHEPGLPTILVLVLSLDSEPWRTIETEGQRRTWASPEWIPEGCRVVYYYGRRGLPAQVARVAARMSRVGGSGPLSRALAAVSRRAVTTISTRSAAAGAELVGDRLRTRVPEAFAFTLPKLLAALRWATSGALGRFDYVYRTNTSSYVDLDMLRVVAAGMPRAGCYAGWLGGPPPTSPPFVRGAGVLLSWDVACDVAAAAGPWSWGTSDDAALGRFLVERGLEPLSIARVLLRRPEDVRDLPEEQLRTTAQFRCKSHARERLDHLTMAALHARLRAAGRIR